MPLASNTDRLNAGRVDRESVEPLNSFGTILNREYYVSEAIFEHEISRVLSRQWVYAGHVSDIPMVGDYFVHEFLDESIIVVREREDRISAYLNLCTHRGYRLCDSSSGNARNFVCPYHQWTYDLDGRLKHAPHMADGEVMNYSHWGLQTVFYEIWGGLIFVCLAQERPPSLVSKIGEPAKGIAQLEPQNMREAFRETLHVEANWKTQIENYLECYHCTGNHPGLAGVLDIQGSSAQTQTWTSDVFLGGEPLRKGAMSLSSDGALVSTPLGVFNGRSRIPSGYTEGIGIVPTLSRALFHIDHAIVHTINPIAVDRVDWTTRWYVHADALEGRDYDVEALIRVWRTTNHEDQALSERNYKGVRSRYFVPGPLSPTTEGALRPTLDIYLEMMRNER